MLPQVLRLLPFTFLLLPIWFTGCKKDTVSDSTASPGYETLDQLGISVDAAANRPFSYTDKKSGYYYATTHSTFNTDHFAGWNIAMKRVLKDYQLYADGKRLDRPTAKSTVFPHKLEREFAQGKEVFLLFDDLPVLGIQLTDLKAQDIGIEVTGDLCTFSYKSTQGIWFYPKEDSKARILVTTWNKSTFKYQDGILSAPAGSGGFLLVYGVSKEEIRTTLEQVRTQPEALLHKRWDRMEALAKKSLPNTTQDSLDHAIAWLTLTLDQLVTNQLGQGIYAGLPWFNDYWGRDMFVSLPGACLVSGQFEVARQILLAFATLQYQDPKSPMYGRVPNRARPEGLIYNTVDGTPRFVDQIFQYVQYSADTGIIRTLYPVVRRSIEGSLKYWVDHNGYLTHDDADTWMDAKIKGKTPYSPRGNRANDIQALWVNQLRVGATFAQFVGDSTRYHAWDALANQVATRFRLDFPLDNANYLADRLWPDGKQDTKLRPNQLFALDLLDDDQTKRNITRLVWEKLTYPWGVASLSQEDPDFHPYHEHWSYYHKDASYHNGTVWLWLNGIAMQRMIEVGQTERAYALFTRMNKQALWEGAVGSLSENADALPKPGTTRGKPSGTFLQAWSNAEQLRIWNQYFLGIQPAMSENQITLSPAIPSAIRKLQVSHRIGQGDLAFEYSAPGVPTYSYSPIGFSPILYLSIASYGAFKKQVADGSTLKIKDEGDYLDVQLLRGKDILESFRIDVDAARKERAEDNTQYFKDVQFCVPFLQPNLKSLSVLHNPPLTY